METKTIRSIKRVKQRPDIVYNLEIENNHNYFVEGVLTHNSPAVVIDEAALVSDDAESKAMRMVGGFTDVGMDFVVKIGNPFKRNHFLQAYLDPAYHKINIDYKRGIREGRLTQEFVDEMRKKPFFNVMYGNEFPLADDMDDKGWTQMISESVIRRAMEDTDDMKHAGEKRIGNDVAHGGSNFTAWVLRSMNYAQILGKSNHSNLLEQGGQTAMYGMEHKVPDDNTFIDDAGVGGGLADSLHKEGKKVIRVNFAEKAMDERRFMNKRSECYWRLAQWLNQGGKLEPSEDWFQLCNIKYMPDTKGRIKIMSKKDMRARGIDSPDVGDALALTFTRTENARSAARQERRRKKREKRQRSGKGVHVSMGGY